MKEKESLEELKSKEEGMGKEKKAESKEAEKLAPAFLIYRDNDLFKGWVPKIAEMLKALGRKVEIQSFPAGTPEEEIENWYLAHKKDLQANDILADCTVQRSSKYELKPKVNLDNLMNAATEGAITDSSSSQFDISSRWKLYNYPKNPEDEERYLSDKERYLSDLGEMYKKILTSIPEEKRQKMEVVILKGILKDFSDFPPLIEHEPFFERRKDLREDFERKSKETNEFAKRMKGWFNEAGIHNIAEFLTGAEIPTETIRKLIEGQAYIIFDRHSWGSEKFWGNNAKYYNLIEEKAALRMPLETFYDDAQRKIGLKADPQKMEDLIRKKLQENLAKEEEK